MDFYIPGLNFTADQYPTYNFTISPGETRCIEVIIIDDNIAKYRRKNFYYNIGVYNPDRDYCDNGYIHIEDNEGKLLHYSDISRHIIFQRKRHFDGLRIPAFNS